MYFEYVYAILFLVTDTKVLEFLVARYYIAKKTLLAIIYDQTLLQ